eukprot:6197572-Pleurochrysis_carterae.AAC.5
MRLGTPARCDLTCAPEHSRTFVLLFRKCFAHASSAVQGVHACRCVQLQSLLHFRCSGCLAHYRHDLPQDHPVGLRALSDGQVRRRSALARNDALDDALDDALSDALNDTLNNALHVRDIDKAFYARASSSAPSSDLCNLHSGHAGLNG